MRNPRPKKITARQEALYAAAERDLIRGRALSIGAGRLLGDFPSKDELVIARNLVDEAISLHTQVEIARAHANRLDRNGKAKRK